MGSETAAAPRPLRAHAARNRELILQTARKLFAERGTSVTLNDIAHAAGVGVGTVYRRFPDKEALLDALSVEKFAALVDLIGDAVAVPDPRDALRGYLHAILELRVRDRALHEVLARLEADSTEAAGYRTQLAAGADALIARAREAGAVRDDFGTADFPILMTMIGAITGQDMIESGAWRRWADLLVDAVSPPG
jgi:AcrR family transcriptional regulator